MIEPKNEQGVIALFSQLAKEMGYTFKEIGTRCPDAILEKGGLEIRVEFEYVSLNFKKHKHNPADVDLIICWRDNYPNSPLPVLSLYSYLMLTRTRKRSGCLGLLKRKQPALSPGGTQYLNCYTCHADMEPQCSSPVMSVDERSYWITITWTCPKCNYKMIREEWCDIEWEDWQV